MTRLSLKVVYLWRHVSSTAPPLILWWWNLETLFAPFNRCSPFIRELRCQVFKWKTLLYSREDPKRSLYCEMSVVGQDGRVDRKGGMVNNGLLTGPHNGSTCPQAIFCLFSVILKHFSSPVTATLFPCTIFHILVGCCKCYNHFVVWSKGTLDMNIFLNKIPSGFLSVVLKRYSVKYLKLRDVLNLWETCVLTLEFLPRDSKFYPVSIILKSPETWQFGQSPPSMFKMANGGPVKIWKVNSGNDTLKQVIFMKVLRSFILN
jgi:hypothetical protein